jgi:hypothetical protein
MRRWWEPESDGLFTTVKPLRSVVAAAEQNAHHTITQPATTEPKAHSVHPFATARSQARSTVAATVIAAIATVTRESHRRHNLRALFRTLYRENISRLRLILSLLPLQPTQGALHIDPGRRFVGTLLPKAFQHCLDVVHSNSAGITTPGRPQAARSLRTPASKV